MKIVTWNICSTLSGAEEKGLLNIENKEEKIISRVLQEDPDIIVFTEFSIRKYCAQNEDGKDYGSGVYGRKIISDLKEYDSRYSCDNNSFCSVLISVKRDKFDVSKTSKYKPDKLKNRFLTVDIKEKDTDNVLLKILGIYAPSEDEDTFFTPVYDFAKNEENAVIIGDFNVFTEKVEKYDIKDKTIINPLNELYKLKWSEAGNTWDNTKEGKVFCTSKLDYAFLSPSLRKRLNSTTIFHDVRKGEDKLSDHSMLVIDIDD